MNNFNLLISTSRFNERNAKAELWFTLLMCGDEYPIIFNSEFSGLFSALTNLKNRDVLTKIKEILNENPDYFQFILKIVPVDFVCETDMEIINEIISKNCNAFIKKNESFKIEINRRKNDSIERNKFISLIADNLDNKVDLDNPDKIIRFEIIGSLCGISFLKPGDILRLKSAS